MSLYFIIGALFAVIVFCTDIANDHALPQSIVDGLLCGLLWPFCLVAHIVGIFTDEN